MKNRGKLSLTVRYVLVFGVLMLLAIAALGILTQIRSSSALRTMTDRNMVNIASAAADLMDGDVITALTEEDVGSPAYQKMYDTLTVFQNNVNIKYIYLVRPAGDDRYVFVIDPDPVEPAAFGETDITCDAQISAGHGVAAVNSETVEDRWGSHHSAYSPVFDSSGKVAGLVGVDFDTTWYTVQMRENGISILIMTLAIVLIAAAVVLTITAQTRRRILEVSRELNTLTANVNELTETITSNRSYRESMGGAESGHIEVPSGGGDEIGVLDEKIRAILGGMQRYLDYMHAQAYTDALTQVGNTTAYQDRRRELEKQLADGSAAFGLALFDINDLKRTNDDHSHAAGDEIIRAAGAAIVEAFGLENTYRVGGDEFVAIAEGEDEAALAQRQKQVDAAVAEYNAGERPYPVTLALSKGGAVYRPGEDADYKAVFTRADEAMYADKREYYRVHGDRRRR